MIFDITDKWRDSSVFTKFVTFAMALNTVLTLVCGIILFGISLDAGFGSGGYFFWMVFSTGINALLTFGIFKVARIARAFTIWEGLIALLYIILGLWALKASLGGFLGILVDIIIKLMPADGGALIALFIAPSLLQAVSALLLMFCCGRDFAKERD